MLTQQELFYATMALMTVIIVISAIYDGNLWNNGGISRQRHWTRRAFTGIFVFFNSWVTFGLYQDWTYLGIYFAFQGAYFWLFFDMLINFYHYDELKYIFKVGNTAFLDRIFHGKPLLMLSVKLFILITLGAFVLKRLGIIYA